MPEKNQPSTETDPSDLSMEPLYAATKALEHLGQDLGRTEAALKAAPADQYLRRQMVRNFCSYVETQTSHLQATVLFIHDLLPTLFYSNVHQAFQIEDHFALRFHFAEAGLLREVSADIDDDGQIRLIPKYIPSLRSIRYTWKCYLHAIKTDFSVDFSHHGWSALRQVIALRNRLTHPRSESDLMVSDDAIKQLEVASLWFRDTTLAMTTAGNKRLEAFSILLTEFKNRQSKESTVETRSADLL